MWGPNVRLWDTLYRLRGCNNFGDLFTHTEYHSSKLSQKEELDHFLFDTESAEDLSMNFDYDAEKKNSREKKDDEERTLFKNGGLIDLLAPAKKGTSSQYSHTMLTRIALLPERTEEGIAERQRIFRALEDEETRARFLEFYRRAKEDNRFGQGQTPFIDVLFKGLTKRYHSETDSDVNKTFWAFQNMTKLLREFAENDQFQHIYAHMMADCPRKLRQLNDFVLSGNHQINIDGQILTGDLTWGRAGSQEGFEAVNIAELVDTENEPPFMDLVRSRIIWDLTSLYRDEFNKSMFFIINNLAAFEACLNYAEHISHSQRTEWCIPEVVESREPFIELEGYRHPLFLQEDTKPNNLYIGGDGLITVFTGANDAGKTQHLRALAHIVALAHAGLPIPAKNARMSLFSSMYTNFGGKDDSAKGRYKTALSRWMYIFENLGKSLVLADEPTDGTFPDTGVKHGVHALKTLEKRSVPVVLTTHYHNIARAVESGEIPRGQNLHVTAHEKPDGTLAYTYQIGKGPDYKSYGDEVGNAVGFTDENLERIAKGQPPVLRHPPQKEGRILFKRDTRF